MTHPVKRKPDQLTTACSTRIARSSSVGSGPKSCVAWRTRSATAVAPMPTQPHEDLRQAVVVVQQPVSVAAFGHPVGHRQQRLARLQIEGVGREFGGLVDAEQHLRLHHRRHRAGGGQLQRRRMSGAGNGAMRSARALLGLQLSIDKGQEARLGALAAHGHGLGGLLGHGGVQLAEHGFDTVALPGEQPHQVAGEPRDGHRLGVLALDVTEQEGPAAVAQGKRS